MEDVYRIINFELEKLSPLKNHLLFLIFFVFSCIFNTLCFSQKLIINEVSQGLSGGKEYVEFLVVPNLCNNCIDLRGWIIDDNNGYFSGGPSSGVGIAPGAIRFSQNIYWSCIPTGTLITIYNDADLNPQIGTPDTIVDDNNCNLIIPVSSILFDRHASSPNNTSSSYLNTGWTAGGSWWSVGMSNSNDSFLTIEPSSPPNITHGISWGNNNVNNMIYFNGSASGKVFSFINSISNDPYIQANWSSDLCSNGNETPGQPNNNENALYIASLTNNCTNTSPPPNNSVTNLTVCNNQLPYLWNNLTFNSSGSQTDTLIGATGCDSLATLNLTVILPSTSNLYDTICDGQLPYLWNGLTFNSSGSQTDSLTNSGGCDSLVTMHLAVNPYSTSLSFDTICDNQLPFTWNGLTFNDTGVQTDTLIGFNGCDSLASLSLTVTPPSTSIYFDTICDYQLPFIWNGITFTSAGIKTDTLTSFSGCDSLNSLNLEVLASNNHENGTANSIDTSICSDQLPFTIDNHLFENEGIQIDTLFNISGCDSIVKYQLTVYDCHLIIPTAFTPDNDLINDFWELTNIDLYFPENSVHIYDRWGELLFQSTTGKYSDNPWNGQLYGKNLPVGSYFYIIDLNKKGAENKTGSVSIIR